MAWPRGVSRRPWQQTECSRTNCGESSWRLRSGASSAGECLPGLPSSPDPQPDAVSRKLLGKERGG